jgi:uncharacterized protein YwqG
LSIFDRFLKDLNESGDTSDVDLSRYREYIDSLKKPAILVEESKSKNFNKIGGFPNLPDSVQWPSWKGEPLSFLCQIDLACLPNDDSFPEHPKSGFLFFFCDKEQRAWGFDPNDLGSHKVIYVESGLGRNETEVSAKIDPNNEYKEKYVNFSKITTYPDWSDERIKKLNLNNSQFEKYLELCSSAFGSLPHHQYFGYQNPVQSNDMDLECQLVTNGLYCGNPSGYNDPRRKVLEQGRDKWTLLLQIDSEDENGMMWGDLGKLYYWIKRDDLKNGNFDNVWVILQGG